MQGTRSWPNQGPHTRGKMKGFFGVRLATANMALPDDVLEVVLAHAVGFLSADVGDSFERQHCVTRTLHMWRTVSSQWRRVVSERYTWLRVHSAEEWVCVLPPAVRRAKASRVGESGLPPCPHGFQRVHLTFYPFEEDGEFPVATFDVRGDRPIAHLLVALANKGNALLGLHIPEPRLEFLSLDYNRWLDPKRTWSQYGVQHESVRPLWPCAHGPCDNPDEAFGLLLLNTFARTILSRRDGRLEELHRFPCVYIHRDQQRENGGMY